MVLWSVTLKSGALTKLGLIYPVVCFIHVCDQTLAEQLYHDKGLLKLTANHTASPYTSQGCLQDLGQTGQLF